MRAFRMKLSSSGNSFPIVTNNWESKEERTSLSSSSQRWLNLRQSSNKDDERRRPRSRSWLRMMEDSRGHSSARVIRNDENSSWLELARLTSSMDRRESVNKKLRCVSRDESASAIRRCFSDGKNGDSGFRIWARRMYVPGDIVHSCR